jgi:hypothetical protein
MLVIEYMEDLVFRSAFCMQRLDILFMLLPLLLLEARSIRRFSILLPSILTSLVDRRHVTSDVATQGTLYSPPSCEETLTRQDLFPQFFPHNFFDLVPSATAPLPRASVSTHSLIS